MNVQTPVNNPPIEQPKRGILLTIYLCLIIVFLPLNSLYIMFLILNNNPAVTNVNDTLLGVFINVGMIISAILLFYWHKIGAYGLILIPILGLIKSILMSHPVSGIVSQLMSLFIMEGILLFLIRNKWKFLS